MPNLNYTVEDFCKDPHFIHWVLFPNGESNRLWKTFMADYPHKIADIQLAIDSIKTIQFQEINPSEPTLARLKQQIWNDIDHSEPAPGRVVPLHRRPVWAAAAVLLVVLSAGLGWWAYLMNADLTYQTAYGKIQAIQLADGSVVTLNANSSLKVADDLSTSPVREVWLTGEAYFDIAKRQRAKFIVHTPEARIEVLGTEFNVNTRRQQTNVVLHEGKVQLQAHNQSAVVMQPGDMAIVTPKSGRIELHKVQPSRYDAWKESYLVLDDKSLPDIIQLLEDTFGVRIKLDDAQLGQKKLTGKLRTEIADDCIENLAIILDAEVRKEGETYVLE